MKARTIVLCTTSKLALGKLRRIANVALALKEKLPAAHLTLMTNGNVRGLTEHETALFRRIVKIPISKMAHEMINDVPDLVIVGTIVVPNLHKLNSRLCLILRQVTDEQLARFRLEMGRPWDLVMLPHPEDMWLPAPAAINCDRIEPIGWIYRDPQRSDEKAVEINNGTGTSRVLITTGGGKGDDRGNDIRTLLVSLVHDVRQSLKKTVRFIQALGPQSSHSEIIPGIDQILQIGPNLHTVFSQADLVISTAGYNSVLELACTDVPVLLLPIPRYSDDQYQRADLWADKLGMSLQEENYIESVKWIVDTVEKRLRRPVIDLGGSGAYRCAELIQELLYCDNPPSSMHR